MMWPNAPHRVSSSAIAAAEALTDEVVGETRPGAQIVLVQRFSVICPTAHTTGDIEAMALYAGESVAHVRSVQPAADIVTDLVFGAERLLGQVAG
jgi:hypothetical protein